MIHAWTKIRLVNCCRRSPSAGFKTFMERFDIVIRKQCEKLSVNPEKVSDIKLDLFFDLGVVQGGLWMNR